MEENRRLNGEEYFYAFHISFEHFFGRKWCNKESQEQGHWHHSSPSLGKNLSEEGRPHVCKKKEKSRKSWEILGAFPRSEISPPGGATTKYYYHYYYAKRIRVISSRLFPRLEALFFVRLPSVQAPPGKRWQLQMQCIKGGNVMFLNGRRRGEILD